MSKGKLTMSEQLIEGHRLFVQKIDDRLFILGERRLRWRARFNVCQCVQGYPMRVFFQYIFRTGNQLGPLLD
ncbi:hypothetical protein D3C81_2197720 [compost metagenome]